MMAANYGPPDNQDNSWLGPMFVTVIVVILAIIVGLKFLDS